MKKEETGGKATGSSMGSEPGGKWMTWPLTWGTPGSKALNIYTYIHRLSFGIRNIIF